MKRPWLAFLLNFIIAGLGFVYLRQWMWAIVDLAATVAIGIAWVHFLPQSVNLASTILTVANGTIAMSAARAWNAKRSQAAASQSAPAV